MGARQGQPITVSDAVALAKGAVSSWPTLVVDGEVSGFRGPNARSGHCYFEVKDAGASMSVIVWRGTAEKIGFELRDGLSVRLTGGAHPVLSVRDTGVGIAEEDKTRIFDRFYTVDKSHGGEGGGFGLGLAIVKKLCLRAGWKLSVESTLGEGTEFRIEFAPEK